MASMSMLLSAMNRPVTPEPGAWQLALLGIGHAAAPDAGDAKAIRNRRSCCNNCSNGKHEHFQLSKLLLAGSLTHQCAAGMAAGVTNLTATGSLHNNAQCGVGEEPV